MKKSRFTEEQISYALPQAESGTPVADVCRQLGVSEASFDVWKKKYGKLDLTELRKLRQLRDENARLKRVVADLTLDKHILGEVVRKKLWSRPGAVRWSAGSTSGSRSVQARLVTWPSSLERPFTGPEDPGEGPASTTAADPASQAHVPASWPSVPQPTAPGERWSMDFVHDQLLNGRPFRLLTVVDHSSGVSAVPGEVHS